MTNTSISPYVAALLSDAAYTLVGAAASTAADGKELLSKYGWIDITLSLAKDVGQDYFNNTPDNYTNEFRVFENKNSNGNQIVFAFKGSKQIENFVSDLNPTDQGYSAYMSIQKSAQAYYEYIKDHYVGYTILTDGHSLGGGMAQEFAVQNDLSGYGQNSLPIAPAFISDYSTNFPGKTFDADLATVRSNQDFKETNVAGDIATLTYSTVLHGTYINYDPTDPKNPKLENNTTTISSKYPFIEASGLALALVPGFQGIGTGIAFGAGVEAHLLSSLEPLIKDTGNSGIVTNQNPTPAQSGAINAALQSASSGTINADKSISEIASGVTETISLPSPTGNSVTIGNGVNPILAAGADNSILNASSSTGNVVLVDGAGNDTLIAGAGDDNGMIYVDVGQYALKLDLFNGGVVIGKKSANDPLWRAVA